jgi:antagonist of KipI
MLKVIDAGALCTLQDLGRMGHESAGVPRGGAMDVAACKIANRIAGNANDEAVIEITLGASFEVIAPCVIAVAGADLGATLNRQTLPMWTSVFCQAGARIAFEKRRSGARAYLALAGGIDVPMVLRSRSTYLPAGFGGMAGRALQMDDVVRPRCAVDMARVAGHAWPAHSRLAYRNVIRVLPGPHVDVMSDAAKAMLVQTEWRVSATSNRMGLRLDGPALPVREQREIQSMGVFAGVVQLPPDGRPIVLMADAQPTGGYPVIAVVIQADLPHAAQLFAGDVVRFEWTTHDEAVVALHALRACMDAPIDDDEGVWLAANAQ